jgi:small conductance mechanosensitive channel
MMILEKLGIQIGPILAAAGVLGLAVGFGAQKLVEDVISGFFILLEDQIRVNDVVVISGTGGLVEKVNLRMVVLRDLAGNVHYIRNGSIGTVTNMTKEYSRYVFDIGVAYREDTDEVVEVIKKVDEEMRADSGFKDLILEPIEILGVDKFADSAVIIKARTKTKPVQQWAVGREFNRRLKKKFDELGIEIPFPHTTLYMGQDKNGNSPALNVSVDGKK